MDWRVGGPSRRRSRVRGLILSLYIPVLSFSGSPVAEVLGNKLVTLGDLLLPAFIYSIYILVLGGKR
jgi:hypothetical protein